MKAEEANKQWHICIECGAERVFGQQAEEAVQRAVAKGMTFEEAEAIVKEGRGYLECPTPEKHTKVMVPLEELENGAYYHGKCRNATVARWNAETQQFVYMREKFGTVFPEEIGYWIEAQPGEHRFDEFKPYGKLDTPLFEIPMTH